MTKEKAIKILNTVLAFGKCDCPKEEAEECLKMAIKALTVQSAQPEIIQCKDCVYFTPEKSGEHWNVCRFYDAPKTADGFCNDAETKVKE